MKLNFVVGLLCLAQLSVLGQTNNFKSDSRYWKNRSPYAGYWQQDVHYTIDANINEKTHIVEASEALEYTNNSPDTLTFVYFHLYQNAFTRGSYLEELHKANKQPIKRMGRYQEQGLGTTVNQVKVNGVSCKTTLDNTILKVELPKALYPNGTCTITMNFNTYFDRGEFRRRMALGNSFGFPTFNGVHWYPRISVYDMKKGWDVDQHLNKELYGDYGQFDVSLTFPANYIVEATGNLVNEPEVLPQALREQLDIKNFANKAWNEAPSTIIPYDSTQRKTWRYHAINVHDFAFTANPHYRLGETTWNGIRCIAIVKEHHCSRWQNAPSYVASIIKTFSEDFGLYEYPKMVAADADDGMEYPMLTLDGGGDPDYRGLLVHEIGHNWFYGMIGNNETYRAALDEGFTQFLTAWGLNRIDGPVMINTPIKNKYVRKHKEPALVLDRNVYNRYMFDAVRNDDKALNTHSNDFHSALGHENGYSNVYHKTATMLYNLQYVLGDELFLQAMKHYVAQWKFCHPYFEDFRRSIIEYTHQDLNWFFDQWLETMKHTDYGITKIKQGVANNTYHITFKRYGEMQMPVDFRVTAKNGKTYDYTIPNTYFVKQENQTALTRWYGWDLLNPTYTATVTIPSGIKLVQIDPSNRLADIDMMDNYKRPHQKLAQESLQLKLEHYIGNPTSWKKYNGTIRPDIWYNNIDGIKVGIHFDGSYMNYLRNLYATVWYNTRVLAQTKYTPYEDEGWYDNTSPIDYTLRYDNVLKKYSHKIKWGVDSRFMDGYARHNIHSSLQITDKQSFRIDATTLYRRSNISNQYLFAPVEWSSYSNGSGVKTKKNSYIQLSYRTSFQRRRNNLNWSLEARAPFTYNYSFLQTELNYQTAWKRFDIRTRFFGRLGFGTDIPYESAVFMQGANPEELMENKFTRSQGILPLSWGGFNLQDYSHIHGGGGLNLRGYTGYYAVDADKNGTIYLNYKSRSGVAVNAELDVDRYFSWIRPKYLRDYVHLDAYLFGDAGMVERGTVNYVTITRLTPTTQWSKVRADAGVGAAITLKRLPVLETVRPFTVRVDCPFFLSAPVYSADNYINWKRWVVGINRSF